MAKCFEGDWRVNYAAYNGPIVCVGEHKGRYEIARVSDDAYPGESKDIARLISAAPEMYKALANALAADAFGECIDFGAMRAAIRKATP